MEHVAAAEPGEAVPGRRVGGDSRQGVQADGALGVAPVQCPVDDAVPRDQSREAICGSPPDAGVNGKSC